jgi:hypothetical protein
VTHRVLTGSEPRQSVASKIRCTLFVSLQVRGVVGLVVKVSETVNLFTRLGEGVDLGGPTGGTLDWGNGDRNIPEASGQAFQLKGAM